MSPDFYRMRRASRFEIRPAEEQDMAAIRELIRLFPRQRVIGCCSLQIYSKRIAEVRSLAVHPDFQDRGVASRLV
jgi:N-acetylglutamate synthase-like GNAT family acetyltransferase